MKKVLASVLAGSMILGMAAAASAATSLKLDKGSGDYDYQIYLFEPDGRYEEDTDSGSAINSDTKAALKTFSREYSKFRTATSSIEKAKDYFDDGVFNVFDAYSELYTAAKLDTTTSNVIGKLKLVDPKDVVPSNNGTTINRGGLTHTIKDLCGNGVKNIMNGAAFDVNDLSVLREYFADPMSTAGGAAASTDDLTPSAIETRVSDASTSSSIKRGYGEYVYDNKASIDIADDKNHYMYTYGEDNAKEVKFEIVVQHGEDFRVDVASGKVTVSRKRVEADTANDVDRYLVTIKAAAGVRDFELDDFKVEMDLHDANRVYYIEGEVAYSDYREVLPDERYIINKSNTDKLHNDGSVFDFSEVIDDETRIVCNDYVDLLFKGNYGTDFENLRVLTDDIKEVEDFFQDYDIDYYDFIGTPKFAKDITVRVDADSDAYIYEFDKKTGDVVDITDECEYTSDGMTFKRKSLKTYVVLEEPYEGGNVKAEKEPVSEEPDDTDEPETETPDDKDATGSKPNPGTGAYPLF